MIVEGWVTLATENLAILRSFYASVLDATPDREIPGVYVEFRVKGLRLGLFPPRLRDRGEFSATQKGTMSLCLQVEDIHEAINQVTRLGYPPGGEIQVSTYGLEIYVYDPDGNRLILHQLP